MSLPIFFVFTSKTMASLWGSFDVLIADISFSFLELWSISYTFPLWQVELWLGYTERLYQKLLVCVSSYLLSMVLDNYLSKQTGKIVVLNGQYL